MDTLIGAGIEIFVTVSGRLAVWLFSLGRWRSEPLGSEREKIYSAAGSLSYVHEGHRVITHTGQLFAGVAFYVVLLALGVLYAVAA